jgi:hypothetical protein
MRSMAGPGRIGAVFTRRLVPALISAAGVTLLAAGLLVLASPSSALVGPGAPTAPPSSAPASTLPSANDSPSAPAASAAAASASPSASSSSGPGPSTSGSPAASTPPAVATRIVIPALKVDLPLLAANGKFPLCNVAQYWVGRLGVGPEAVQPGEPGTTWIFAHAREGMFLPLLDASQVNNGKAMIGYAVQVYTSDSKVYWYSIDTVKRHTAVTDWSLGVAPPPGVSRLVLQTSEGPLASSTKLQIGASLQLVQTADPAEAHPTPRPIVCS